jgi:pantoate--beta-alanine ligase
VRTIRTVAELRAALAAHRGLRIGLVPTMGAFHDGHLALMRRARADTDVVVVSLFVNPSQFNERADLDRYPHDEARDGALAADLGVDYLFAPAVTEVYPDGFATTVTVDARLTGVLEGAQRGRTHFDAVTTVVSKLFNMVGPDIAYFGQKDAQQALVIRRMVQDLNLAIGIVVVPTVRDHDGLAMSSRNMLLSGTERQRATALHRALRLARHAIDAGERDPNPIKARVYAELTGSGVEPQYFELVEPDTLVPVQRINGEVLAVVAARVGATRLIDNETLSPSDRPSSQEQIECVTRC